jgi:tripartite-type tricarboxylate transporter receptor subunit TctC
MLLARSWSNHLWCVSRVLIVLVVGLCAASCRQPAPEQSSLAETAIGAGGTSPATTSDSASELSSGERQAAEAFYKGKTVSIVVGSGAGGGFDTTARIVSRHIGRHIPGQPTVIVINMPGGGGLVAANHMFNAAPKDGLVVGVFHEAQVMNQLTGSDGVQFDLRKFNWLGSSYDDPNVCLVRTNASVAGFKALIGAASPIAVGGTGPGSNTYDAPRVLAAATGANIRAVAGYQTTNDVRVGVEREEIQGMCLGWQSAKSQASQWLDDKYVQVIVQNGATRHKDLPNVPLAVDFARSDADKAMLRLVDAPGAMAKPFALPPGVEESRVRVMRSALMATYRDPAFLEEARTLKLEFQPKTTDEIQALLNDVLSTPRDVALKYGQIIAP